MEFWIVLVISVVVGLGVDWLYHQRKKKGFRIPYGNDIIRVLAIALIVIAIWLFYVSRPIFQEVAYFNEGIGILSLLLAIIAIASDMFMRASD